MIPEVGAALKLPAAKMLNTATEATWAGADDLRKWGEQLEGAVHAAGDTIARLLGKTASGEADIALANSSVYLDMMGHVVIAWMWLQRALVAHVRSSGAGEEDRHFYRGKLQACQYFFNWELPKIRAQKRLLDSLDRTCLDMRDEWF